MGKINSVYDAVIKHAYFKPHFNIFFAFVIGIKVVVVVLLVAALRYELEGRAFHNRFCHWKF
jgi:tetrahydromethanopterin S-methyltransferase subunit B